MKLDFIAFYKFNLRLLLSLKHYFTIKKEINNFNELQELNKLKNKTRKTGAVWCFLLR